MTEFPECLQPWATDPNEGIRNYISREVDRIAKEMALAVESGATDELIGILRSKGYLVLAPSDTSPVGELVRAAVKYERAVTPWEQERAEETLNACISVAFADHAIRAWVERGRK